MLSGIGGKVVKPLRVLRARFRSEVVIMAYHRVANLSGDPWNLAVTPEHFEEHLQVLKASGQPLSLQQLIAAIKEDCLPSRAFVVTFDDGYADNLLRAKPLLEKYDVPATVFVATDNICKSREFWWDDLERYLVQPKTLPNSLEFDVGGDSRNYELGNLNNGHHRVIHSGEFQDKEPLTKLYFDLHKKLKPLEKQSRGDLLTRLQDWAGVDSQPRETHRLLTPDEIKLLADGDLVEIGAHTVTHPQLSALSLARQKEEINQGRLWLEDVLEKPVCTFSYPFGCFNEDYTLETVNIVKELGFSAACSLQNNLVRPRTDLFQLPRFLGINWNGDIFSKLLTNWFIE